MPGGTEILLQNKNKWSDKISVNTRQRGSTGSARSLKNQSSRPGLEGNSSKNMQLVVAGSSSSLTRGKGNQLVMKEKEASIPRPGLDLIGYKSDSRKTLTR